MGKQTTARWISDDAKQQHDALLSEASEIAAAMRVEAETMTVRPLGLEELILYRTKPLLDAAVALRSSFVALDYYWVGDVPDGLKVGR